MKKTPKSLRCHISLFGRRNVGKSSILNALTHQNVSIVSDHAGTTTDPVEKPMELLPIGPVLFIDTAGIDDVGTLGQMRIQKTKQVFDRTDIAIIVTTPDEWGEFEEQLIIEFQKRNISFFIIINKTDCGAIDPSILQRCKKEDIRTIKTIATENKGILEIRQVLLDILPDEFINPRTIVGDIVMPGEMAILVVPIDKEAPKGRLILPQVQVIRDLLDHDAYCTVVKERELRSVFQKLKEPPRLVITDSQAFLKVSADTPRNIPLTSFSILFARFQGDLLEMVKGAFTIETLKKGDKILIAEVCSHHPIGEDIGRVKIPRWLTQYVGGKLDFDVYQGKDFPENLSEYKLVIHCGGCMSNRRLMLSRIVHCRNAGVPITNYGLTIAYSLGIFNRALEPFPSAMQLCQEIETKNG